MMPDTKSDIAQEIRFDRSRHILFARGFTLDASAEELLIDLGIIKAPT